MKKNVLVLCVVLACVAPAMAADWYEIPDTGSYAADNFQGFNYNPTPDATVLNDWLTNTYAPPYDSFVPTPYYETVADTPFILNDPTAQLRFNMITARFNVGNDLTVGTVYMGDTYWPLNYSGNPYGVPTYSTQSARQSGGNVTADVWNFGRPVEIFETDYTTSAEIDMATDSYWNIRGGSLNIGTINVLNTSTAVSIYGQVNNTITTTIGGNTQVINIGDMNLNDQMMYMYLSMGVTTISGDISDTGNLNILLHGNSNLGGDRLYGGVLNLQMTELMQIINAGQIWVKEGSSQYQRVNYDAFPTTAKTLVTAANMYDLLDVDDLGDGMVSVALIPEPATMALLGLGALVLRRKK
jgi:hypothetical protein